MILRSLSARLILGALVWIGIGVSLSDVLITRILQDHVLEWVDAELLGHLTELAELVVIDKDGNPQLHHRLSDPRFSQTKSGFYWQIDTGGLSVVRSPSLSNAILTPSPPPPAGKNDIRSVQSGPNGDVIIFTRFLFPQNAPPIQLQIGVDTAFVDHIMHHFKTALHGSILLLFFPLLVAALLQIRFGLMPMRRLRLSLSKIKNGKIDRLPDGFPSEIQPLVNDLNGMIEVNDEMVQRARLQAGNLAHGLKTPMAILSDEAYRLDMRGETEAAAIIKQQCQIMSRQIDYQLARARAAATRATPGSVTPISARLNALIAAMRRLYPAKEIAFPPDGPLTLSALCDPMDFDEMLGNLLDNACKWANRTIALGYRADPGQSVIHILVDDDGPGIQPDALESVFNVGKRLDEQVHGSGLGLPIVRDIAQLYGGDIKLSRSPLGGLRADLSLRADTEV